MFKKLNSCGLITNYYCSSKCKHCSYCSSPSWSKDYIEKEQAEKIFRILKSRGCNSIHIGGGEPFLNTEKLIGVLDIAQKERIYIEYIETNASWCKDETQVKKILSEIKKYDIDTLLISIDPYHNEYVPFYKSEMLISTCNKTGIGTFIWKSEFFRDLKQFDKTKTHSLDEYTQHFGNDYIVELAQRYGIGLRGRALETYREHLQKRPIETFLTGSPCTELLGTYHFHVDLYGNFVPQSCPGISIDIEKLDNTETNYPLFTSLVNNGVKGLLAIAKEYGFVPKNEYISKCDLCVDIRKHLATVAKVHTHELQPIEHYTLV